MNLFRDVMDKEIVDCYGYKSGKVDDLVLELRDGDYPAVRCIVTGHGADAQTLGKWAENIAAWFRSWLLGSPESDPNLIPWDRVSRIDVVVHVELDRDDAGLIASEKAIWERWIKRLPFAER